MDFTNDHSDWTDRIREQAQRAFEAAFRGYAVIVSHGDQGQDGHTVFVVGQLLALHVCGGTTAANAHYSRAYYPAVMGEAQVALGQGNPWQNLSPSYPPANQQSLQDFLRLMDAIGRGIGSNAAHEIGHQFGLPKMDCKVGVTDPVICDNDDPHVLEYYNCEGDPDQMIGGAIFYFGRRN